MTIPADLPSIVFMKVGLHAGEDFEAILQRKRREYEQEGRIFWGYGGGTMHPLTVVQPFARSRIQQDTTGIRLVMQEIVSRHPPTSVYAKEYSADGVKWEPIPPGIQVRGSRYALVLDEIEEGSLQIQLSQYQVGIGPSEGRRADDYIKGRVDKGCLEAAPVSSPPEDLVSVKHSALIKPPFAVLLR